MKSAAFTWLAGAVTVALLALPMTAAFGADTEAELAAVRARLGKLRDELRRSTEERDETSARLRDIEMARAEASRKLERLRVAVRDSESERARLERERAGHEQVLAAERDRLASVLRLAYFGGEQERLKLLLRQDEPGLLARTMVYHSYISRSRAERVEGVRTEVAVLQRLESESAAATARLRELEGQRAQELAAADRARTERAAMVARLEQRVREQGNAVRELEGRERQLAELLERVSATLADFPIQADRAFAQLRGQLAWPVNGRLLADYGATRAGSMRWNGVLIGAQRGTDVHAIADGRVAFSDWLPGLGLLAIVDHGHSYLSLYGNNDTLRKSAGDWVQAGEVLGTVGDSGGQARAALYFEIRRGRAPQNPHPWFRTKLAGR